MDVKILSWNIWCDGYFDQLQRDIDAENADIIALQEVVLDDPSRDIIDHLRNAGYHHVYDTALVIPTDGRRMGNAVFSKYPIVGSATHVLSEVDKRIAVQADIDVRGKLLHVFSVHLLHTHQQPSETQVLQANNLLSVLPATDTIVMGDFNAMPDSDAIRKISSVLINADPSSKPTWCEYAAGCPTCDFSSIDICLDYIFTTNDLSIHSFDVIDSIASDHLPISAVIELL